MPASVKQRFISQHINKSALHKQRFISQRFINKSALRKSALHKQHIRAPNTGNGLEMWRAPAGTGVPI
jgi:hypothetical protein